MVARIAPKDPARALELARSINEAWYRCQALSSAALHHPDSRTRARVIDEALDAALKSGEPNRVVTVSAWPIKVLAMEGRLDRIAKEVDRLLNLIRTEPSPVRRADALKYLFGAVVLGKRDPAIRVIEALASACLQPLESGRRNRKGESLLADCLPAIARIDGRMAAEALARLSQGIRCTKSAESGTVSRQVGEARRQASTERAARASSCFRHKEQRWSSIVSPLDRLRLRILGR
jgi:hypothetical protein